MLEEINHFIQNLNSEDGNHKNTIISYKYDINQFKNFLIKKKKSFKETKKKDILKIGLALSIQKINNVPVTKYDKKLDYIEKVVNNFFEGRK